MREVEPDVSEYVPGSESCGIPGEGDGFLGMREQDVAFFSRVAVSQQLKHTFGVDALVPNISAGLEAVRGELDEQNAGLGIGRQKMV